ncbi:Uncharacterized protein LW94_1799 [Fusarium fujikuroi]|nr:Uncharacterized protein Y057_14264 [Fusarium fujikuroi]KLP22760.1 Uncharacterized protein LW94_1799 [Fusarium fujikuroi]
MILLRKLMIHIRGVGVPGVQSEEIIEQQRTRTLLCVQTIRDSLNEALLN